MINLAFSVTLAILVATAAPLSGAETVPDKPNIPAELTEAWQQLHKALQDWSGRFWQRMGGRSTREYQPQISMILDRKDQLALNREQVQQLEQLRDGFDRQRIRNDADMRIVELDIATLLDGPRVDVEKVEQKIREAEKLRGDLRIARVRAIEQAKAVLTSEQRQRFHDELAKAK